MSVNIYKTPQIPDTLPPEILAMWSTIFLVEQAWKGLIKKNSDQTFRKSDIRNNWDFLLSTAVNAVSDLANLPESPDLFDDSLAGRAKIESMLGAAKCKVDEILAANQVAWRAERDLTRAPVNANKIRKIQEHFFDKIKENREAI